MIRISKFLKFEAEIVVARDSLTHDESKRKEEALIYLHPDFARRSGVKEGDVVEVSRKGRSVRLRVKLSDKAPENGGLIPNGIFASYLADMENFKRFRASLEVSEGKVSTVEEILRSL
ncbi:MAG: molybdopterin dinucleotide binding domain-containing protein [Archaeoglobaceae archaeon]